MTDAPQPYTREFFADIDDGAYRSASVVLALVLKTAPIQSIVDFGCGTGAWLRCAAAHGIRDLHGLDGDWVPFEYRIEQFTEADLTKPITLSRRYDFAMCLEVAEHLPASAADTLVASLTRASHLVLFSAAVPNQGGTNHINEQWQDYWVALFADRGFGCSDTIRHQIWGHPDVEWWYQQNILLFGHCLTTTRHSFNIAHPRLVDRLAPQAISGK
jgi:Methyltransferase domain